MSFQRYLYTSFQAFVHIVCTLFLFINVSVYTYVCVCVCARWHLCAYFIQLLLPKPNELFVVVFFPAHRVKCPKGKYPYMCTHICHLNSYIIYMYIQYNTYIYLYVCVYLNLRSLANSLRCWHCKYIFFGCSLKRVQKLA